ncbi:Berberine bridge enzyme [Heracleum sosnowskyi]|uniref:Berberine bridge enzyme n=1 Tax=Heracleum sosnowskyi TaxID=360622 RepID=A0AAD8NC09_9APIA|nr:Berberine bridge enzyme [Heracleum sosnowskyi]
MKILFATFFLFFGFLSTVSSTNSHEEFLQCLARFSPNSNSITKVIYTPQNSSYTSVLEFSINNLRFATSSTPKPLVIVTPVEDTQIQTVIYCSKKHDIQVRIRGGGHDYEGLSYVSKSPFVLLDMINYRSIDVDHVAATAWVQSGATLGELYYSIAEKSNTLGFPGGFWYTVGVSGIISGGGYGSLRRKYGLAADNVIDARIIDVNGRILDRKSMGEDLFWAIRGGGASSFGVILSWKLKLVSVPEIVTAFRVDKTIEENGTEIVHRWQTIAPKLPKDVEIRVIAATIWKYKPNPGARTVLSDDSLTTNRDEKTVRLRFSGFFLGRQDELLSMMNTKFKELGLAKEHCVELSYIQSALRFSLFPTTESPKVLLNRTSFKIPFKAKSSYAERPISRKGLNGIWTRLLENDPGTTNFIFTSYGGKMDEISESAIPFPHRRGTLFMIYMRVQTDGNTEKKINWIRDLYKYLTPYVTQNPRTSYVNYNDLDLGVNKQEGPTSYKQASIWGKKYFKNNFDRLVRIKSIVDPGNFFRHEQSIPPCS